MLRYRSEGETIKVETLYDGTITFDRTALLPDQVRTLQIQKACGL